MLKLIIKHMMRLKNTLRRRWHMIGWNLHYGKQFKAEKFHFRDNFNICIEKNGQLTIGRNCFFNNNCSVTVRKKVTIGANCIFGENVSIYDHNHCYSETDQLISKQGFKSDEVVIEDDCWIATNVTILKGVHIGRHSVIRTGVIVYKDVPANSVIVCKQELINK